ncbi:MAG: alpha/beta hydrolase [Sphingopyxis sp.]
MVSFSHLLRRLISVAVPAMLAVVPMAVQAAGGTGGSGGAGAPARFATDGISTDDTALSWSETSEDYGIESATADNGGVYDDAVSGGQGNGTSRLATISVQYEPVDAHPSRPVLARSGPFYLIAADTVEMIGTVDSATPRQFAALLAAHPAVRRLVMVECPGSVDEAANHILARAVRHAGLTTIVPRGGSVRSGAVDLFLAGVERLADASAEFGVHSWQDEDGNQAADFPADDPVHAEYLGYYREMGLNDAAARGFYALTNSVPFESVRTLSAADMQRLGLTKIAG